MVYSQNNEQDIILNYFKDFTGTVLDIGANDGKTFSNSLALIEKGWTGFLYEPSPSAFAACKELHRDNKKVTVINKAISDKPGKLSFFDCDNNLLSSSILEIVDQWKTPYKEIRVDAIPYSDVKCKPDFITIDAEGMDMIILKQKIGRASCRERV
jgi:FkbM family methyltransferase